MYKEEILNKHLWINQLLILASYMTHAMKYFVSLRILCILDIGRRGSNITNPIICWTLSKWNQKPTIYGPKQDDEHLCPHHYMSSACVAGGFFGLIFVFGSYLYSRMQVKWKNRGGEG